MVAREDSVTLGALFQVRVAQPAQSRTAEIEQQPEGGRLIKLVPQLLEYSVHNLALPQGNRDKIIEIDKPPRGSRAQYTQGPSHRENQVALETQYFYHHL